MKEGKMNKKIASRVWMPHLPALYVREMPHEGPDGGPDWGYTDDPGKATPLSPYWYRRFAADMRRVGAKFNLRDA
jgi:hypothetical protein